MKVAAVTLVSCTSIKAVSLNETCSALSYKSWHNLELDDMNDIILFKNINILKTEENEAR